ncbi:CPBP family intramembrane glutamic endopeptidase [Nonomuraea sp. NPDC049152]|uniref:CPBP family intramembrane glutamic endopeptidase n=1 Tax=Nonomuraea sp. NPDC049152 TaxID=3154350 RepID=UPI0033D78B00
MARPSKKAQGMRLVIGIVVSAVSFAMIHAATDRWLNLYYVTFGASLAVITWRTGGPGSLVPERLRRDQ